MKDKGYIGASVLSGVCWIVVAVSPVEAVGAHWADGLFVERSHDFGPVPRGGRYHHEFVLTNRMAEPISILHIRASCGCTTGRASTGQVAPGQSAVVEATIDTRNFVGRKATTLYVTLMTAGGKDGEARLGVSAEILSDIVLNPGAIDFGTLARGQSVEQALTIDRVGSTQWRIERMVSASRALKGQLVETARGDQGVSYSLKLALRPDAPAGIVRDEIQLLTNDPETPSITIPVTAQVRGELAASPGILSLGRVNSTGGRRGGCWSGGHVRSRSWRSKGPATASRSPRSRPPRAQARPRPRPPRTC